MTAFNVSFPVPPVRLSNAENVLSVDPSKTWELADVALPKVLALVVSVLARHPQQPLNIWVIIFGENFCFHNIY
jgi:hypothetical protein